MYPNVPSVTFGNNRYCLQFYRNSSKWPSMWAINYWYFITMVQLGISWTKTRQILINQIIGDVRCPYGTILTLILTVIVLACLAAGQLYTS